MLTALLLASALDTAILPPAIPWNGASRSLVVPASDPWVTPSERDQLRTTPRYDETVAYLRRLVAASRELKLVSLGKSGEGRDVWMVIASKERAFTPEALRNSSKPIVFAQAGIHAGEIDGKDAGLMLLRDMTVRRTKRELLDKINFLFVPIFNTDGHERFSKYTRINQRGPEEGGWRSNARNLNLNRDYMKADTPEMRAMIRALATYDPDLYIDLHVTDGADYQYDVTYGWNGPEAYSPRVNAWMEKALRPEVDRALREMGHIPGPLIFTDDPLNGINYEGTEPRLSTGYGDARHIATILVENHSLKPYDQRVLGTYVFLEAILRTVARRPGELTELSAMDRAHVTPRPVPFTWRIPENAPPEEMEILGIESRRTLSPITGSIRVEWLGKPVTKRAPVRRETEVVTSAMPPEAYWIPPAWQEVIALLDLHGIDYERTTEAKDVEVTMYRLSDPHYVTPQFEGHVRVTATVRPEKRREHFPAGTVVVPGRQHLGTLATLLLEPDSPDSLFQWGFFHSVLTPTEYVEPYIMEPMAERMMAEDPKLAEEFQRKIDTDEAFRASPRARLQWFYEKTLFDDERVRLYPVGRQE